MIQGSRRDGGDPGASTEMPEPSSLRHYVVANLRGRIISGALVPGTRLVEAELASNLGTSRGPVREALRQLEQEGLVEFFPRRGAVVIGVPEDEVAGVYELRAVIEARGFTAAARFISKNDIDNLTVIAHNFDAAMLARDIERVAGTDHRFHAYILELSGLTLLRRIWDGLDGLIRVGTYQRLVRSAKAPGPRSRGEVPSHQDLLDALDRRDPELIRTRVIQHILGDREAVL